MSRVAILYICTGKYDVFWKDFFDSYEKFFLPDCHKEYFIFTDAKHLYQEENERVHVIFQKSLGWPDNTLMRYHMFAKIEEKIRKFDYIFFMNANCQCVGRIDAADFLPYENELLVVQHPGFYNKSNLEFTYDRNPKSKAYIAEGKGEYYICGGVNGGTGEAFLRMMHDIVKAVNADKENKTVALWHDESHINKYILEHRDFRLLTPAYCYPEGWELPYECKILIRDKSKWLDVDKVKISHMERVKTKLRNTIDRFLR